jgi:SAM-dependent methyltransferase
MEDLNAHYWDKRYLAQRTGWDLKRVSPPLKAYIDQLSDTQFSVLIPGCGNAYEAFYLASQGFTSITLLDISSVLVERLQAQLAPYPAVRVLCQDFFQHQGQYDLILEQTFFCALPLSLRQAYVKQVHQLLKPGGSLVGLLFDRSFSGEEPPFGGSEAEYRELFGHDFLFHALEPCYNSIPPRAGTELFIHFRKPH